MSFVSYGDTRSSSAALFTPMSSSLSEFISDLNDRTRDLIGDIGRSFHDRVMSTRRRSRYDEIASLSDTLYRATKAMFRRDEIMELSDMIDVVLAKSRMRRYIGACPEIRQGYRNKRLSLWDGDVNDDVNFNVNETPEYLHVVNHLLVDDKHTEHFSVELDFLEDNDRLTLSEKDAILNTWEHVRQMVEVSKLDPTSKWGQSLE